MEKNAPDHINYFIAIEDTYSEQLAGIRHWNNLKVAFEGNLTWVRDLDQVQVASMEVRSIPSLKQYYERDGKLFPLNSKLPERAVPPLLWTPIERALPIALPSFNHNYFGLTEKIPVRLVASATEQAVVAMITELALLQEYISYAPLVRMKPICWAVLNNDKVILTGTPLLPLTGDVFWQRGNSLIPAGYDFELYSLAETLGTMLDPEGESLVLWNKDGSWSLIGNDDLQPLSRGSFRLTMQRLTS